MKVVYCSTCFEYYYIHPQELTTVYGCTALFGCVLVYWCGSAGVGWYPNAGWSSKVQIVKKFPAFHGTRRFITALTSVRHLYLTWASPIQSIYPLPTSWRSILILSTHLRLGLPSGLFLSGFPTKTLHTTLSSPIRATCPAQLILLDFYHKSQYWVRSTNHLAPRYAVSSIAPLPRPSWVQIFSSTPCSQTPSKF